MGVEQTIGIWYKMFGDPKGANDALDKVGKKSMDVGALIKKALAVVSVAAALKFGQACIDANSEADRTAAMLAGTLRSVAGATDKVVASTKAWVDKMEVAKSFDDSEINAALQSLTIKYGDVELAQKGVTVAMEAARNKNIDLATATQQVYMGSQGLSKSLRDYGVAVVKGTSATGYLDKIMSKVAGSSDIFNASLDGQKARLTTLKGNLMEVIGKGLTPLAASLMSSVAPILEKVMGYISAHMPQIQKGIQDTIKFVGRLIEAIRPSVTILVQTLGPYVKSLFNWLGAHSGTIQKVLVGVANAIAVAFRIVAAVIKVIVDSIIWVVNNVNKVVAFFTPNKKQAKAEVASPVQVAPRATGAHAAGGWAGLNGPELSVLGERGPEYVLPNGVSPLNVTYNINGGGDVNTIRAELKRHDQELLGMLKGGRW